MGTLRKAALAAVTCFGLAACGSGGTTSPTVSGTTTKDVTFSADGTTTYATLEVPGHTDGQRLAAALLIAGSGPTDRDGNQKPSVTPNTLKQIADALAGQGVVTLRFDKYFSGQTGAGKYTSDPGSIDLNA